MGNDVSGLGKMDENKNSGTRKPNVIPRRNIKLSRSPYRNKIAAKKAGPKRIGKSFIPIAFP